MLTVFASGFKYKASLIVGQFWKPFDKRFSKVLTRLKNHKTLFESGVEFVLSEEMINHFTNIELEMHNHEEQQQQFQAIMDARFMSEMCSACPTSRYSNSVGCGC
jgi:hypothetical protein